jgi:hypothetical protein
MEIITLRGLTTLGMAAERSRSGSSGRFRPQSTPTSSSSTPLRRPRPEADHLSRLVAAVTQATTVETVLEVLLHAAASYGVKDAEVTITRLGQTYRMIAGVDCIIEWGPCPPLATPTSIHIRTAATIVRLHHSPRQTYVLRLPARLPLPTRTQLGRLAIIAGQRIRALILAGRRSSTEEPLIRALVETLRSGTREQRRFAAGELAARGINLYELTPEQPPTAPRLAD